MGGKRARTKGDASSLPLTRAMRKEPSCRFIATKADELPLPPFPNPAPRKDSVLHEWSPSERGAEPEE